MRSRRGSLRSNGRMRRRCVARRSAWHAQTSVDHVDLWNQLRMRSLRGQCCKRRSGSTLRCERRIFRRIQVRLLKMRNKGMHIGEGDSATGEIRALYSQISICIPRRLTTGAIEKMNRKQSSEQSLFEMARSGELRAVMAEYMHVYASHQRRLHTDHHGAK